MNRVPLSVSISPIGEAVPVAMLAESQITQRKTRHMRRNCMTFMWNPITVAACAHGTIVAVGARPSATLRQKRQTFGNGSRAEQKAALRLDIPGASHESRSSQVARTAAVDEKDTFREFADRVRQ
jgi:hypothetical protein